MKKIYSLLLCMLCTILITSCEDFMDIHKEYIEGGEIIYAPKPDTVMFIAGKGRIQFFCRTYNSPNVKSVNVYWNDGLDSLIIPASFNSSYDSIQVILDNMPEQSYTFNVQLIDNFNHRSLIVTDFGTSYGDNYQAMLMDRRIRDVSLSDKGASVTWYSAAEDLFANEIRYVKNDGTTSIVRMPAEEFTTFCPDAKSGEEFEFRSLFIPEEEAIDTFYTAWSKYTEPLPSEYKFDRTGWTVTVSDETASDGGGKDAIIDDDLGTWWHSSYTGGNAPLPHWAVIDMLSPKDMSKIELYRRAGNTDSKSVELYIGNSPDADGAGWVQIATGVFSDGDRMELVIPESVNTSQGQYLKVVLPDSNREPFTNLAEVYIYGK